MAALQRLPTLAVKFLETAFRRIAAATRGPQAVARRQTERYHTSAEMAVIYNPRGRGSEGRLDRGSFRSNCPFAGKPVRPNSVHPCEAVNPSQVSCAFASNAGWTPTSVNEAGCRHHLLAVR